MCVGNVGLRIGVCWTLEGAAKWVLMCVSLLCAYLYMLCVDACRCTYVHIHVCAHTYGDQRKGLGIILQAWPEAPRVSYPG